MDWTFVCPTEIIAFSERIQEFRDIGVEVGGRWPGLATAGTTGGLVSVPWSSRYLLPSKVPPGVLSLLLGFNGLAWGKERAQRSRTEHSREALRRRVDAADGHNTR